MGAGRGTGIVVGVEAGQVALVALLFPLIHLLARMQARRLSYRNVMLRGGSLLITAAGLYWLVERLIG